MHLQKELESQKRCPLELKVSESLNSYHTGYLKLNPQAWNPLYIDDMFSKKIVQNITHSQNR
jgi:hypothetical protein